MQKPIVVPNRPASDQFSAGLRQLLLIIGAGIVSRGYMSDAELETIVGALVIIIPFVWGQLKTRRRAKEVVTLANFAPATIAQRKAPYRD